MVHMLGVVAPGPPSEHSAVGRVWNSRVFLFHILLQLTVIWPQVPCLVVTTVGHSDVKTRPGPRHSLTLSLQITREFATQTEATTVDLCLKKLLDPTLNIHTIYTHLLLPRTQHSLR